jgi:outer membrane protein assembly factor BamB/3',5'-cyclic AMP phosphodiesterase CpdA
VTVTDGAGRWELAAAPDAEFVFVTVPATHIALQDFFLDVRDETQRPAQHSFTLAPRPDGRTQQVRFVQVTDLHLSVDEGAAFRALHERGVHTSNGSPVTGHATEDEVRADLFEVARLESPAFIAATGDLANHGKPDELAAYKRTTDALTAATGIPTAHVPGNHDYLSELDTPLIERFTQWWAAEGRHAPSADPVAAFQAMAFRGDWHDSGSGRAPWLEHVGPAWYSFDWGPAHFVVYDSEGLLRYGDEYPQDRWLAADLDALAPGTPVIALLHFSEPASFFDRFSSADLIASFAGHWHANRVATFGSAIHHVTSNLGFGGIDHSPRGYRVIEVDGTTVRSEFRSLDATRRTPASRPSSRSARWQTDLGGTAGLGPPARVGGVLLVATETDAGAGAIVAIDAATGRRHWRRPLEAAVRHSVRPGPDDTVVALTMTGAVVSLGASDGEVRWAGQLGDPWVRWCLGAPAVAHGLVYAGAAACFGAFDARSGALVWQRDDLASADWLSSWCSPAIAGDVVLLALSNDRAHFVALDAATGDELWRRRGNELESSWSSPVVAGGDVLVTTIHGWLRARAVAGGEERWTAPLDAPWPVATPVVGAGRAFTVSAAGTLQATLLSDGSVDWRIPLGPTTQARQPYRREPAGHVASPAWGNGAVVAVSGGGRVIAADPATGHLLTQLELDVPVASSPLIDGNVLYCATVDGRLHAQRLDFG